MDWLTRLPVIGPLLARLLRTRAYRVFEHFNEVGSNRMAGAVTFFGFLALFPLLTVAVAVAAATLGDSRVQQLQHSIEKQVPALSQSLDLNSLVRNAGTVGLVSGVLLLISGLGWVDTTRVSLRMVWHLPTEPDNVVLRKVLDVGVLVGLGVVAIVSIGASSATTALAGQVARWIGNEHSTVGRVLLGGAGFVIAVGADMLLFSYLLVGLPRIPDQRKHVVAQGALIGAVGFELLKLGLSAYLANVASKSIYGAFGTPVALLLWINFIFRLLFFCAAWTATDDAGAARARARARAEEAWLAAADPTPPADPTSPVRGAAAAAASAASGEAGAERSVGARRGGVAAVAAGFAAGAAVGPALRRLRARLHR